jgi:hypothetical protein
MQVGQKEEPLLCVFYANLSKSAQNTRTWKSIRSAALSISDLTINAGLSPLERQFSNVACGSGKGSDANDPGFARCRFHQYGVYIAGGISVSLSNLIVANASKGLNVDSVSSLHLKNSR